MCRTNAHLLIQILQEHNVWKINYSRNTVQVSYMMMWERENSEEAHPEISCNCISTTLQFGCQHFVALHNHIFPTAQIPNLSQTLGLVSRLFLALAEFPNISRKSKKQVTLYSVRCS